jgi:hypothetical protein
MPGPPVSEFLNGLTRQGAPRLRRGYIRNNPINLSDPSGEVPPLSTSWLVDAGPYGLSVWLKSNARNQALIRSTLFQVESDIKAIQNDIAYWQRQLAEATAYMKLSEKDSKKYPYFFSKQGIAFRSKDEVNADQQYLVKLEAFRKQLAALAGQPIARVGPPPALSPSQSSKVTTELIDILLKQQEAEKQRQKEILDALKKLAPAAPAPSQAPAQPAPAKKISSLSCGSNQAYLG